METLKSGYLAFFDTFAGLIPCKVLKISGESGMANSNQNVKFQLTAKRGVYNKGEILESSALHICLRKSVFVSSGQYRIRAYNVEVQE